MTPQTDNKTVSLYVTSDGLLWAWGHDAEILAKFLQVPLRTGVEGKTVFKYIAFRYKGDLRELRSNIHRVIPYEVVIQDS